jgi:histidine kinase/DNA gyrase B/HSP90-like ATPase/DNA topoisomerase 6 subunit A-like protein
VTAQLERVTFSVSRAADFLDVRALESQTGQPRYRFGDVVVKELLDNALDACETAGVPPEISVTVDDGDPRRLTVADNGPGIPAGVVGRILDYSTLTSDKALYRSPCRGAQGNALKTIIGIPHALGVTEPVIIEAQGIRHEITVSLDMAGELQVSHEQAESPRTGGTTVTVPLPASLGVQAAQWVRSYALVNPHATLTFTPNHGSGEAEVYKAAVQDGFRKPLPTDPTSAHWYDTAAFTRLIGSLAARGDDRPLGGFIREFAGLSATAKAKRIAARVPGIARVGDVQDHPGEARELLSLMQAESSVPKPAVLGQVPREHYEDMLEVLYGVDRSWFRRAGIVHDGVAWQIEVTVADTNQPGSVIFATNYGVTFGDPLGSTGLETSEIWAEGAQSFLSQLDAVPDASNGRWRAAVVHVTCAAPVFLDKGKVSLDVPDEAAAVFAKVLWNAGRELYREAEAAQRDEEREERREQAARRREAAEERRSDRMAAAAAERKARERRQAERARRLTVREAVFRVIREAVRQARDGSDLPFSAHTLFYKIRPLALALLPPGTKIKSKYIEQVLIPEHEREHGRIAGMYRDPRGTLHEPHTGREIPLGTREVRAYVPPTWTYDKILVIEKAGLWPAVQAAGIAERYDMAVITSEGYSAEACRELLAGMPAGDVQIFALHDADLDGYNIGRTLGEATARMPGHSVKVTDLGLTVDIAIDHGLESEEFTRKRALPETILPLLSPVALEWFTGDVIERDNRGKPKAWLGRRVELNAFSSRDLIAYIEEGLAAHGATGKVIPPRKVLHDNQRAARNADASEKAADAVSRLIDMDAITLAARRIVRRRSRALLKRSAVREQLAAHPDRSWRAVSHGAAAGQVAVAGVDFDRLVRWLVMDRLNERIKETSR